jgi:hypothetical protein
MWKLSSAIACALCLSSVTSFASSIDTIRLDRPLQGWPVHDQVGTARLDALPDLLASGVVQAGHRLAQRPRMRAVNQDHDIGWIWAGALSEPANRRQVKAMFDAHLPVLVLGAGKSEQELRAVSDVFGFASRASVAVYVRDGDDWRAFSIDAPLTPHGDLHMAARQLVSGVGEWLGKHKDAPDSLFSAQSTRAAMLQQDPDPVGERHALPRMNLTDTRFSSTPNGSSATLNMTVIRDSTTSKDKFVVVAKSSYNMIPHQKGLSGGELSIPHFYKMTQSIRFPSGSVEPSLIEQFPRTDNGTDINISETRSKETSYGFNISREISGGLQGTVPEASAKLKFGFNFSRTYREDKTVAFSIKDYSLISSARPGSGGVAAEWTIQLAPAIFGDKEYFGKKPSIGRVTPTMQAASPETFAVWEFDATYQGTLTMDATSTIENAKYNGSKVDTAPDPRPQAIASVMLDLSSAYLTRETTVFIRSDSGNGGCLWDENSGVVRKACPDTGNSSFLEQKYAQWRLDENGRYINRGSGQCMRLLSTGLSPTGRQVTTARCSLDNDQRWEWRADRIYSLYNGAADDWRLHVDSNGLVNGRTVDKGKYQDLPTNPFQILLIPWSTYPSKPVAGVFVPNLTGLSQPPIPEDWLRFNAVGPDQTWKLTVLRQSLMP